MFAIKLLIAFLISIAASIDVKYCNDPLLINDNANAFAIQTPTDQNLAELGTNNYWQLTGDIYRTMRVQLNTPHYITGIGIKVNTENHSPCNYVENEIVLSEFEIIIDNDRVDLANRNTVNDSFIKVATPAVSGTNIQISKVVISESTPYIYCIQYQLYGCIEVPTDCRPLLSYDTIEPVSNDTSYTGVCVAGKCSGGLGALHDGNFDNTLRWKGTTHFSLSLYQQVGIHWIAIYTNSSVTIATDSMFPSTMETKHIKIQIRKTINFFEFDVVAAEEQFFDLQEIKISYWNDFEINCSGIQEVEMATVWIAIGVGVFMFMLGVTLPIVIWFIRRRALIWKRGRKGNGPCEQEEVGRTEHVYTDIQSRASTTEVNNLHRINIVDRVNMANNVNTVNQMATTSLPTLPNERKLNFTESMEEEVRKRNLERIDRMSSLQEDNPIYSASDPDKIARNDSEIFTRENPQYVTNEMMRMHSAANMKKITYENTMIPVNESLFNAYDKLDRNKSN